METFELAIEIQRNAAQEPAAGDCAARAISRRSYGPNTKATAIGN